MFKYGTLAIEPEAYDLCHDCVKLKAQNLGIVIQAYISCA